MPLERWWWWLESKGEAPADRSALWVPARCLDESSDCARWRAPKSRCRRPVVSLRPSDFHRRTDQCSASGNLPASRMPSMSLYRSAVKARPYRIKQRWRNGNLNKADDSRDGTNFTSQSWLTYVNVDGEGQVITVGTSVAGCHYEAELGIIAKVKPKQTRRHLKVNKS